MGGGGGGVLVGVEGVCVCVFDWSLSACLLSRCCHFLFALMSAWEMYSIITVVMLLSMRG